MALQNSRILSLLLVISFAIIPLILTWGYLSDSISWITPSGKKQHRRDEGRLFGSDRRFWAQKGNATPALMTTSEKSKIADPTRTKPRRMRTSKGATVAETHVPVLYKKSFDKLPQWEFEDVYILDSPPRNTTCAQSLLNSKDQSFSEAFLPNIRLFLHKGNFNASEWNRLSHFNNPFGFMEYRYDDVMPSVNLIPKPREPLLLPKPGSDGCIRCAVVGTAGILNGSKMGKEIDAHDYVFRMNVAVIKGYEEDVGKRTSVYVFTSYSMVMSMPLLKNYGHTSIPNDEDIKYVMIPEGLRDFNWLKGLLKGEKVSVGEYHNQRPRTYYGGQYNEARFYVLHQDFLRYVRNRFLKSAALQTSHWSYFRPTNGAFALFLALHTCDIVSAYGFMTEDYKKYSNYYYEKKKTEVVFYVSHDYILEKDTWKKLHDRKIIKLYQKTQPETGK